MIIKECEICGRLTQYGCRFCPRHKTEVDKHYENFKIAAHEKAVNLAKLQYNGERILKTKPIYKNPPSPPLKEARNDSIIDLINDDLKKKNQSLKNQAAKIGDKLIDKK